MERKHFILLVIVAFVTLLYAPAPALATSILKTADSFAVLAGSEVKNTSTNIINGNVGVSPGTAISGFNSSPGVAVSDPQVTGGQVHATTAVAEQAQIDNTHAYNALAAMMFPSGAPPGGNDLTGIDLGGLTLPSGVYHFDSSAQLTGTLTLDAQGNNNAFWVFQIVSTLTTAGTSSVVLSNLGTHGGIDDGVFWQVGSSATLGATTTFEGNILALASITLGNSATIDNGRALAQTAKVTLDTNTISIVCLNGGLEYDSTGNNIVPIGPSQGPGGEVPEPATMLLLGSGLVGLAGFVRREFKK